MQCDPWPVLRDLYRFLGWDFTDETRAAMQGWREAQPRGQHGAHQFHAGDFGLDEAELRARFAFYSSRCQIDQQDQT